VREASVEIIYFDILVRSLMVQDDWNVCVLPGSYQETKMFLLRLELRIQIFFNLPSVYKGRYIVIFAVQKIPEHHYHNQSFYETPTIMPSMTIF